MYRLLPVTCWYLCEAWKDVRFVVQGICVRHDKMYYLLLVTCWYLCCVGHGKMHYFLSLICWYLWEAW